MNNYGYPPPIYTLPGGFDLEAFIKFQEYVKTQNPNTGKIKSKSEIKDFLRLWNAFKEADEKKQKEEAEKKKKDEEEKKKKEASVQQLPTFSFGNVVMIVLVFGLPVGAAWLSVLSYSMHIVKGILFP